MLALMGSNPGRAKTRPRRVEFGLGAVLLHSNTPSLRVAGFEDDDEDEYEERLRSRHTHCPIGLTWIHLAQFFGNDGDLFGYARPENRRFVRNRQKHIFGAG